MIFSFSGNKKAVLIRERLLAYDYSFVVFYNNETILYDRISSPSLRCFQAKVKYSFSRTIIRASLIIQEFGFLRKQSGQRFVSLSAL